MVKRKWQEADIKQAFFPVIEQNDIYWFDKSDHPYYINGYKAIVNGNNKRTFAVVSNNYHLVLNEDAYKMADYFIKGIFNGLTLNDFKPFNVYLSKTKSSCRIDLIMPNSPFKAFGKDTERFIPFVRISNSYNKTVSLKYEIGFCRWMCLNGCIFGGKSMTFSFAHNKEITNKQINIWIEDTRKDIGQINNLWIAYEAKLKHLKEIDFPQSMVLPIFCKIFDIKVEKKERSQKRDENLALKANVIINASKEYFNEMGNNAYALYNVLTDYASYPLGGNISTNFTHGYQRRVGSWIDEFIQESGKEDFSLSKYIGDEAMDIAFHLESICHNSTQTLFCV